MKPVAIVDTNIVVAGLLTSDDDSPVARVLSGMLAGAVTFVLSEALLAEYRRVLVRPKLLRLHGLLPDEIDAILTDLAQLAILLHPEPATMSAPDPGDQHLWDLLATRDDLVLVTGDARLLADAAMRGWVVLARDFVVDNE
jgi:putative PIN family toxin of toxin-antitoxin system